MKLLAQLVGEYNKTRLDRDNLKSELENRKNQKYAEWREQNPNDRTAMEKVIAMLKAQDPVWQQMEEQLNQLNIKYAILNNYYQLVLAMLQSQQYTKDDVEQFISLLDLPY